jgi:hypothetical protein
MQLHCNRRRCVDCHLQLSVVLMQNILQPMRVPWMISPSVSGIQLHIEENGDSIARFQATTLPDLVPPGARPDGLQVEVLFKAGQWVRTAPAFSDQSAVNRAMFSWDKVPFSQQGNFDPDTYLVESRRLWVSTGICPNPEFYEVEASAWVQEGSKR